MKRFNTTNFVGGRLPILTLLSVCLVMAQASNAEPHQYISYRTIPIRVEKDNPDLRAARLRVEEAAGRHIQSGKLSNPSIGAEVSSADGFRERGLTISLTQQFPLTKRLSLEKKVTKHNLEVARAEIAEVKRTLVSEARQSLVRFIAVKEQRALRVEQISIAKELGESLQNSAAKGEVSILDAGFVKLEVMQLQTEIRQLDAHLKAINGELKPLLGLPVGKPIIVGDNFGKLGGVSVNESMLLVRADIEAAKLRVDEAQARERLERARKYNDIEVDLFAGVERAQDAPEGFENDRVVGIGFSLPLPFWNKNEGNIKEAEARVSRRQLELAALTKKSQHEVKAANDEREEWISIVREVDSKLIPAAEKQYQLASKSYSEGISDIQTVLRSREKLVQLKQHRITALSQFYQARARYESALGY